MDAAHGPKVHGLRRSGIRPAECARLIRPGFHSQVDPFLRDLGSKAHSNWGGVLSNVAEPRVEGDHSGTPNMLITQLLLWQWGSCARRRLEATRFSMSLPIRAPPVLYLEIPAGQQPRQSESGNWACFQTEQPAKG